MSDLIGTHVSEYFVIHLAQYNKKNNEVPAETKVKKSYDCNPATFGQPHKLVG